MPSADALPYALGRFRDVVDDLRFMPLTAESEAVWATQPVEFSAEAYALALTEPDVSDWVSSALREWMQKGGDRAL